MSKKKTPFVPATGSRRKRGKQDRPAEKQPLVPADAGECARRWTEAIMAEEMAALAAEAAAEGYRVARSITRERYREYKAAQSPAGGNPAPCDA